jgi:hypothetical protein
MVQQAEQPTVKESLTAQAEPVAWLHVPHDHIKGRIHAVASTLKYCEPDVYFDVLPLYTHPQPAQQPLTEEQIQMIDANTHFHESPDWLARFARAIERAHRIGGAA